MITLDTLKIFWGSIETYFVNDPTTLHHSLSTNQHQINLLHHVTEIQINIHKYSLHPSCSSLYTDVAFFFYSKIVAHASSLRARTRAEREKEKRKNYFLFSRPPTPCVSSQ